MEKYFTTNSISLLVKGLLRLSISSWSVFGKLYFSQNLYVLLNYPPIMDPLPVTSPLVSTKGSHIFSPNLQFSTFYNIYTIFYNSFSLSYLCTPLPLILFYESFESRLKTVYSIPPCPQIRTLTHANSSIQNKKSPSIEHYC